jgi:uncharacterized membrane protein YeiH
MQTDLLLSITEIVATLAFGVSGILLAARYRLDVVGVTVVALLSAFGGGTLRDILLDQRPFFWMSHSEWVLFFLLVSPLSVYFLKKQHQSTLSKIIEFPDTLGLALFTLLGIQAALNLHTNWIVAVLMGVVTSSFGGVLAEICCQKIPSIFNNHRPYATISLAGGLLFLGSLEWVGLPRSISFGIAFVAMVVLRLLSHYQGWHLPKWQD